MSPIKLVRVGVVFCFAALAIPTNASAQLGGLVNRATRAARGNQQRNNSGNTVPITAATIASYVRGVTAEAAEERRLDSVSAVAHSTPDAMRTAAIVKCQSEGLAPASAADRSRRAHDDSARVKSLYAGIDTAKMRRLAIAAQHGDAAAMAEMQALTMQMARNPAVIAASRQESQSGAAFGKRADQCARNAPPASAYVGRIAQAKTEMERYGSKESPAYANHLTRVKLAAAGGSITDAQFAVLQERIRSYMFSPDNAQHPGYTSSELGALRADRATLDATDKATP